MKAKLWLEIERELEEKIRQKLEKEIEEKIRREIETEKNQDSQSLRGCCCSSHIKC